MIDKTLQKLLRSGVLEFNAWRDANLAVRIDLAEANLARANLSKANLAEADLAVANCYGADLTGANLRGANLRGADLAEADLAGANCYGADLTRANLRGANLRGADLRGANLAGADLTDAYLAGAYLAEANLTGSCVNWGSHALIAEILKRAAGKDISRMGVAGLILLRTDWCWKGFLAIDHPEKEWAILELAKWVQPGQAVSTLFDRAIQATTAASEGCREMKRGDDE